MVAPLVTIVIPTYNRGQVIQGAINSSLDQTHPEIEIIVVDDGSTDDTEKIIASLISRAPGRELRYLKQENAGASAARNTGMLAAKGDFIQFLDSDDFLFSEKIEKQLSALLLGPRGSADGLAIPPEVALCFGRLEEADWRVLPHGVGYL